jgi:two-component system nitrate/nitrite response regulator NarL
MNDGKLQALDQLTRKEREVLMALMRGATAREISRETYVSLPTVRSQIHSILFKLGVSSQLAAVAMAYRFGWLPSDADGAGADRPSTLSVGM